MKIILPFFTLFLITISGLAQRTVSLDVDYQLRDTSVYTLIEQQLRQTGSSQKVEIANTVNIAGIHFSTIVVHNLSSQNKIKGILISNRSSPNISVFAPGYERHAFIDESELDSLAGFFENCHNVWKLHKPEKATTYVFETKDKLQIEFAVGQNSQAWKYSFLFARYNPPYEDTMNKERSYGLYHVLKTFIDILRKTGDE